MVVKYIVLAFIALATLLSPGVSGAGHDGDIPVCESLANPKTQAAVELVHGAVHLIQARGEAAFTEFSRKGSPWFDGDTYIFVHTLDGALVANAAFPHMVGRPMLDFKDVSGKPIVQFMIDEVTRFGRNSGWVHYLWPAPNQIEPRWKSSYVHLAKGPDGKEYVVGTGLYDVPMERCFIVQEVENASVLIQEQGDKVFPLLRSRSGPFVWKDTYVFVFGGDGIQYVNPSQPQFEGTDVSGMTDMSGIKLIEKMREETKDGESAWIAYMWPKPGHVEASKKHAYVKQVTFGDKQYIVGCGVYLD